MKKLTKVISLLLTICMLVSLFAACAPNTAAPENNTNDNTNPSTSTAQTNNTDDNAAPVKDTLIAVNNSEVQSCDPAATTARPTFQCLCQMLENLVEMDENGEYVMHLAESVEQVDDVTYLVHLRQGVKFHNGEEMKASDVVFTYARALESAKAISNLSELDPEGLAEIDEYTVQFKTKEKIATFLNVLTRNNGMILNKKAVEEAGDEVGRSCIGTGPYKFVEWKSGTYIKLEKFEDYSPYGVEGEASGWYGYKTQATPVIYYDIVSDNATRAAGIQTGEYDIVTEMGGDDFAMLDSIEGLTTYTELNGEYVVVYNKAEGLCADVNMRQAINAILDANEILLGAYNTPDFFREEISFMPAETATWYTDAGKENAHLKDLDLAKEYLEKANYNGETVRILASPSSAALAGGAVVVQSELAAAGINAELITPDYTSYSAYRNDPTKYDLFFASLIPVAVPTLQIYLSSSWAGFTNDQKIFDAVKEMDATADIPTCQKLWEELQTYLWTESLPASKLGSVFIYGVCTDKVENFATFCSAPTVSNIRVRQ